MQSDDYYDVTELLQPNNDDDGDGDDKLHVKMLQIAENHSSIKIFSQVILFS